MTEQMIFPNTWEEYEQSYGFDDEEQIYTNGSRLIPTFRVKQWLEHLPSAERRGHWIDMNTSTTMYMPRYKCSICNEYANKSNFCPNCGAKMEKSEEE